jgi:hypothetical protein
LISLVEILHFLINFLFSWWIFWNSASARIFKKLVNVGST